MRRVSILDIPPAPPDPLALRKITLEDWIQIVNYLNTIYPMGTSLDDLDVKIKLDPGLSQAAVFMWMVDLDLDVIGLARVLACAIYPPSEQGEPGTLSEGPYKTLYELRLEMLQAAYEHDLAISPLERGIGHVWQTTLNTCFSLSGAGLAVDSL